MSHVRYRLGAEELLELGRVESPRVDRTPFLAGRVRVHNDWLGQGEQVYILDILGSVAGFLAEGLSFALTTLGNLLDVPLQILSQGVDIVFNSIANVFSGIPILGDLLAKVVVLGGSLIKFGLSIPGLLLRGLGNILGGVAKWLKGSGSEQGNQQKVDEAKEDITGRAPDPIKDTVKAVLDFSGVSGKDLAPNVDEDSGTPRPEDPKDLADEKIQVGPGRPSGEGAGVESVLAIGLPVVGVVALVAALA